MSLAEKLFGSFSDRELKKINPITKKVLALETKYQPMSDAELQAQTPALKERLANGETVDDILPDAFAACRVFKRIMSNCLLQWIFVSLVLALFRCG